MKHLDLFSGIGGFAYAADQVWDTVEHTFCEIDPFCQKILKKHYPNSKIYGDIRTLTNTRRESSHNTENEQELEGEGSDQFCVEQSRDLGRIDLLTGGFPCQPFSQAGRRKGTSDDRFLWPEMLRVIRDFKPTWVIAENVRGILSIEGGLVFQQVCVDLENEGYAVQPIVIPACAVGAPHRRDRVWFIAYCTGGRIRGGESEGGGCGKSEVQIGDGDSDAPDTENKGLERASQVKNGQYNGWSDSDASDTGCKCWKQGNEQGVESDTKERTTRPTNFKRCCKNATDTGRGNGNEGSEGVRPKGIPRKSKDGERVSNRDEWRKNWIEVATELCRVDDGLSPRVDGFSASQHRTQRLKSLGNAIVPQVAIEIMKAIYEQTRTAPVEDKTIF